MEQLQPFLIFVLLSLLKAKEENGVAAALLLETQDVSVERTGHH